MSERTVRSACTRHCGDGCALLVDVGPEGVRSVRGNPDHPFTRGRICAKTARFAQRLASPRRVTTPLVRHGADFRPASWDEALELIARRMDALRPTPERMLHIHYHASFGLLHQAGKFLFNTLGASGFSGAICLGAGAEAIRRDFGAIRQGPLEESAQAARIVNWGRNARAQSAHLAAMLGQARENGARVLAIHPGDASYDRDHEIILRPGTDRLLAAAALKLLAARGQLSPLALDRCANAGAFLELLDRWPLDDLLEACDVPLEQARTLADWYAPANAPCPPGLLDATATHIGRGLQRYAHGGASVRFVDALAMLSGNVGRPGGGVWFLSPDPGLAAWDWTGVPPGPSRRFPIAGLARAVEAADPPVDFVWVEGMNLVTQCPESLALERMLRERFTVVVEPFLTDTARAATVVLPPALMLECEDVLRPGEHAGLLHAAKAVDPPGECLPNFEIAARLGARLADPVILPDAETVMEAALRDGKAGWTLETLRREGWLAAPVDPAPWSGGIFAHADGLYHLPDALPSYSPVDPDFPLRLLSPVRREHLLSQIPEDEQQAPPTLYLSPRAAAFDALDLSGPVLLETALGSMTVRVESLPGLHPETAVYPRGDWLSHGGCVNRLIRGRTADLGGQAAYYEERARLVNAPVA
ncbi:Assimilatory nitrate reductase catalytic subunit [Fundidesulfovibrio magnetotacticus]|uniref:Assimilatory nitrate reductase catalytic subunit n=1 Tax=Fundidesulfovibrio magnetotacticus TaxID=2730080 RepID=A0A6V8LM11_9BACT|nr:molybdopterin-dependent oxidoreductase [Fundidesulfovibrio magnetotacticus]GFK92744.1 Assimilatory nitrate reductase catalytic subunit [Fundidesulfovibrio magnetotacticus]